MKKTARTLAAMAALALGAISTAHAGNAAGDDVAGRPSSASPSASSTLAREAEIAAPKEPDAARAATPAGDSAGMGTPPRNTGSALTREQVRKETNIALRNRAIFEGELGHAR